MILILCHHSFQVYYYNYFEVIIKSFIIIILTCRLIITKYISQKSWHFIKSLLHLKYIEFVILTGGEVSAGQGEGDWMEWNQTQDTSLELGIGRLQLRTELITSRGSCWGVGCMFVTSTNMLTEKNRKK